MMASRFPCILRNINCTLYSNINNVVKVNYVAVINCQNVRNLYAKSTLGIDGFNLQRERTRNQMENIAEKFKLKMAEYSEDVSKNMIFTEDLKNMVHLAENEEDVELVVRMIKRFNQQNKQLRFGNYIFGPVVMRLFYIFNKYDLALECFKLPELDGFFDQLMSYQILLDLLYENEKYNEILDTVNIIKNRQIQGTQYPKNIVVLAFAACYKLNSKESLDYALKLWQDLKSVGHFPMRRAVTFCAALALNHDQAGTALEILTTARNQNYTTVRNLKIDALAAIGRVDDVLPILKAVLNEDVPDSNTKHTFNQDVLDRVKSTITKLENAEIALEFNRLEQLLQKQGNISDVSLNEQLCQEIQQPPSSQYERNKFLSRNVSYQQNERRSNKSYTYRQRPGLQDLV